MQVLRNVVHVVSSVFGCQHGRMTRPFTIQKQSYMMCLECGHKVFYSMVEMRPLSRREVRRMHAMHAGSAGVLKMKPVHAEPAVSVADPTVAA